MSLEDAQTRHGWAVVGFAFMLFDIYSLTQALKLLNKFSLLSEETKRALSQLKRGQQLLEKLDVEKLQALSWLTPDDIGDLNRLTNIDDVMLVADRKNTIINAATVSVPSVNTRQILVDAGYSSAKLIDNEIILVKTVQVQRYMDNDTLTGLVRMNREKKQALELFLDNTYTTYNEFFGQDYAFAQKIINSAGNTPELLANPAAMLTKHAEGFPTFRRVSENIKESGVSVESWVKYQQQLYHSLDPDSPLLVNAQPIKGTSFLKADRLAGLYGHST